MVRFDLGALLQGQMKLTKLKRAYNSLIIGPRGLQCETNLWEFIDWESSDVALLQGQTGPMGLFWGVDLVTQYLNFKISYVRFLV